MAIVRSEKPIKNDLFVALINRNVIRKGTELLIPRTSPGLGGVSSVLFDHIVEVEEAGIKEDGVGFAKARSVSDGKMFVIKAQHIFMIDGMPPRRIAQSFGFKPDGSKTSTGKKRGRKPKRRN